MVFMEAVQAQRIRFRNFSSEEGLSNSSVNCMIQDQAGFIWVGTQDGLNRYDGFDFEVFRRQPEDSLSLNNNTVNALLEGSERQIWVGTEGAGLQRYDPDKNQFFTFFHTPSLQQPQDILSLMMDRAGQIWVGTKEQGLFVFDPIKEEFVRHYRHQKEDPHTLIHNRVLSLAEDNAGHIWVGTLKGLSMWFPEEEVFRGFTAREEVPYSLHNPQITNLYIDGQAQLWVCSKGGLNRVSDPAGVETEGPVRFDRFLSDPADPFSLPHPEVSLILEDGEAYWVTTEGGGLCRFSPEKGVSYVERRIGADPFSLQSNIIRTILRDFAGVIWIGTDDGGISSFDPKILDFHLVRPSLLPGAPVENDVIRALYHDRLGNIWIGTEREGLIRYHPEKGYKHFQHNPEDPYSLVEDRIRAIEGSFDGNVWIGTYGGLSRWDPRTQRFRNYFFQPDDPADPTNYVRFFSKSKEGDLYVHTQNVHLYRYQPATNGFSSNLLEHPRLDSIKKAYQAGTMEVLFYNHARIVFHDSAAVYLYRFPENVLETYRPVHGGAPGQPDFVGWLGKIRDELITTDYWQEPHQLWVATKGYGLLQIRLEAATREAHVRFFDKSHGLSNDFIYGIMEDEQQKVWLTTSHGLSQYHPEQDTFESFYAWNGLQSNEFNWDAYHQSDYNDWLLVGGMHGLNYFSPGKVKKNPVPPRLRLAGLRVFNRPVPVASRGDAVDGHEFVLEKPLDQLDELVLTYRESVFSLEVVVLHHSYSAKNYYEYKLEGLERDWVRSEDGKGLATYTSLDPGTYTFMVRGYSSDHVASEALALPIRVLPPPWRSTWAYMLYALAMGMVFAGIFRILVVRTRLKGEIELQANRAAQLEELDQMKSLFFTNITHEFKTPLSLILDPINELGKMMKETQGRMLSETQVVEGLGLLHLMQRHGHRLSRLINQILDLSKLEAGKMKLFVQEKDLVKFLKMLTSSFETSARYSGIEIHSVYQRMEYPLYIDQDKIEKVFSNILSNALKHTPFDKTITVTLDQVAEVPAHTFHLRSPRWEGKTLATTWASLCIADEGKGIEQAWLEKIFERFQQGAHPSRTGEGTGIGLALVKELVMLHYGQIGVDSVPGQGTRFYVYLPEGHAHLEAEEISQVDYAYSPPGLDFPDFFEPFLPIPGTDIRILVVEDDRDIRKYIIRQLGNTYSCLEAVDGKEGWEKVRALLPDLVISDLMMPGMDGIELVKALKADPETDHIPVVLLTARSDEESKLEGLASGATDFLEKPFSTAELRLRVNNILERRDMLIKKMQSNPVDPQLEPIKLSQQEKAFLEQLNEVTRAHFHDSDFKVKEFAGRMNLSEKTLNRKLKSLFNMTPREWLKRYRLMQGARMIARDAGNISEIALWVGFKGVAHFSSSFQDYFGVSPSEYKNRNPR